MKKNEPLSRQQIMEIAPSVFTTQASDKVSDKYSFIPTSRVVDDLNTNGWDGTHFRTGNDLPMGTYIYEVNFQDLQGWKHQEMGHLFIVR